MKTKSCVSDGVFRVAAIDRIAGEARVIAEIFALRSAIRAIAIRPAEPGNAYAVANHECGSGLGTATFGTLRSLPHFRSDLFQPAHNLMAENQRQLRVRQFAVDHVKIGAANSACADPYEQLSPARLWLWNIAQLQRLRWLLENHRAHGLR